MTCATQLAGQSKTQETEQEAHPFTLQGSAKDKLVLGCGPMAQGPPATQPTAPGPPRHAPRICSYNLCILGTIGFGDS